MPLRSCVQVHVRVYTCGVEGSKKGRVIGGVAGTRGGEVGMYRGTCIELLGGGGGDDQQSLGNWGPGPNHIQVCESYYLMIW